VARQRDNNTSIDGLIIQFIRAINLAQPRAFATGSLDWDWQAGSEQPSVNTGVMGLSDI
jgi:hypothetical protein